ncbi:MAG: C40 family peptidase [Muribaculaceae bacterium]|nr:C40 family peptidase [Muribaculaceae bacterium]
MRTTARTLLKLLLLSAMAIGIAGCHSSRKTVRGNSGVPVRKVDYKEMKSDVESRHYDTQQIGALVAEAARWLGVPYKYAGNDKKGVDCSGLTSQVFLKTLNVKMPRSSREQQQWCTNIKKENLQPGDLVFFATGSNRNRVSHVGIYIGNGDIIHASSSRGVIISNLGETYYLSRYHSSGRPDVIHQIYASANRDSKKKNKNKSKNTEAKINPVTQNKNSGKVNLTAPVSTPTISVDELIEMQVDSIATSIDNTEIPVPAPTRPIPTNPASPAVSPVTTSPTPEIPIPSITTEEPTDTIFNQFFD